VRYAIPAIIATLAMIDINTVAAASATFSIFSGAGISGSLPAGLPLGNRLRNDVLHLCHAAAQQVAGHLVAAADLDELLGSAWKLEVVIGRVRGTIGDAALDCLRALDLVLPNEAHLLAAVHLAHGGLHVSLNFDEGIELACDLLAGARPLPPGTAAELVAALPAWRALVPAGSFPAAGVVTLASEDEFRAWDRDGRPAALLKLHGSLRTTPAGVRLVDPVVVDELELAQLSPPRRAALAALAQRRRVLVTGYAGEDIDVHAPLLDALAATATRFTWSTVSMRPGSPVPGDVTARGGQLRLGRPGGLATMALRDRLGLPATEPPWPELPAPGPSYADRFAAWAARLRATSRPEDLAEAYAWMLADAGQYDRAYRLLRALASTRRHAGRPGGGRRGTPRLRNRLADVEYDRNAPGDKPRARRRWLGVALTPHAGTSLRGYALVRIGETYRQAAFRGPLLLRPPALAAAALGPAVALMVSRWGRRDVIVAARAYSALAHLGLQVLEAAPSLWRRWAQPAASWLAGIAASWCARALLLGPGGNRQAFVSQQQAELTLLGAIYRRQPPPPTTALDLAGLRESYRNGGDLRGVANTTAALAVAALAAGDWQQAEQLLVAAEQAYAASRPGQAPDPAGVALVARRRRILRHLARHPTQP
jgi:hypothetical protein